MATLAGSSMATPEIDMTFLSELYDEIENNPPALEARKILIQQYVEVDWLDAARGAIEELLCLDPYDQEAMLWADVLSQHEEQEKPAPLKRPTAMRQPVKVELNKDLELAKLELQQGYEALRSKAEKLLEEMMLIHELAMKNDKSCSVSSKGKMKAPWSWFGVPEKKENFTSQFEDHIQNLSQLVEGKLGAVGAGVRQPESARTVAWQMGEHSAKAVDIAVQDLERMAKYLRLTSAQPAQLSNDELRDALVKRIQTLSTALPDELKAHATTALMHAEHEILHRTYLTSETMLGDPVAEIPRHRFLVTEDAYPWDLEELVQAIEANGGVMRNPLSKQMFTLNDIRSIVHHPIGKKLAALELEQKSLSQGVRPKTIEEIEKMAAILLADQSEDQMASRHVVEGFLAYTATLPVMEQKALDGLRVPAKDSHTGQGYDTTIGEAVRDANGNRVCFHKTGDFLKQAASHLRQKR